MVVSVQFLQVFNWATVKKICLCNFNAQLPGLKIIIAEKGRYWYSGCHKCILPAKTWYCRLFYYKVKYPVLNVHCKYINVMHYLKPCAGKNCPTLKVQQLFNATYINQRCIK